MVSTNICELCEKNNTQYHLKVRLHNFVKSKECQISHRTASDSVPGFWAVGRKLFLRNDSNVRSSLPSRFNASHT